MMESSRNGSLQHLLEDYLMATGFTRKRQRDKIYKDIASLSEKVNREAGLAFVDDEISALEQVHDFLWEKNPERYDETSGVPSSFEHISLSDIVAKELDGHVGVLGNCLGLMMEYHSILHMLGMDLSSIHLEGISDSHVYGRAVDKKRMSVVYLNPTSYDGFDCEVTLNALNRSEEVNPKQLSALAMINMATYLMDEKDDYEGALRMLGNAERIYDTAEINLGKSVCLRNMQRPREALKCIEDLKEPYIEDLKVLSELGKVYSEMSDERRAAVANQTLLELYPGYGPAYARLRHNLEKMGRETEAIPVFQQKLEEDPSNMYARREFYGIMRSP